MTEETGKSSIRLKLTKCQQAQIRRVTGRLAGALGRYWQIRGYFREGREHLMRAMQVLRSKC